MLYTGRHILDIRVLVLFIKICTKGGCRQAGGFCLLAIWKEQLICLQSFCYFCLSNIFLCI